MFAWMGSVKSKSFTHVCVGGICVICMICTCLPGWDLNDLHDLHMFRRVGSVWCRSYAQRSHMAKKDLDYHVMICPRCANVVEVCVFFAGVFMPFMACSREESSSTPLSAPCSASLSPLCHLVQRLQIKLIGPRGGQGIRSWVLRTQ